MMKVFNASLSALLLIICFNAQGQGEIPVNMHTGTPSMFISIGGVSNHDISDGIGLAYNAKGLKLEETEGLQCGAGWSFQGGSSIVREVRGLPDDYKDSNGRVGWLYNTVGTDMANFSTAADTLGGATCSDETAINTTITGYSYKKDTEPDIFYYSAGGVSGSFVFDATQTIRLIPYKDVKIEYTVSGIAPADKKILTFKITTNDGVVYTFDNSSFTDKKTHKIYDANDSNVDYLKRNYEQYRDDTYTAGTVYNSEWKLTRIESPLGSFIKYYYRTVSSVQSSSSDTVRVGIRKLNSSNLFTKNIYITTLGHPQRFIKSMASSSGDSLVVEMDTVTNTKLVNRIILYDRRKASPYVKEYLFQYHAVGSLTSNTQRTFLKSITELAGCDKLPPYEFTYIGVDFKTSTCNLPSIYSNSKDFWGYFNGRVNSHAFPTIYVYPSELLSERFRLHPIPGYVGQQYTLPGADRTPDAAKMQIGSLESIKYPLGGITTFNYEPNDFLDTRTNTTLIGGGLRIKSITHFDGVNTQAKITKTYDYQENGKSSGRLITRPTFVIPTKEYKDPQGFTVKTYSQLTSTQDKYEYLIARTDEDLTQSFDGDGVGYRHVKVSRTGSGSTEYDYYMPAVYGNGVSGQWIATDNKFVRPSGCASMDIVANGGRWAFAYSPNPNFDYERGFPLKRTDRNSSGVKIRETTYTPQYIYKSGAAPVKVWGLWYDNFARSSSNVYFYGKYFLLTNVAKAPSLETVVDYDANDVAKSVTTSSQYFYESSYHKLLSRTKVTGVDGSIVTTKYKYPLDFGPIVMNVDEMMTAIRNLQNAYRISSPIEVTTSLQRNGAAEKVMSASVITFADFGITGKAFPVSQYSLKIDQGITDFTPASGVLEDNFLEFVMDPRYTLDATFLKYDSEGKLITAMGKDNKPVTTVKGFKKTVPVVQASNVYVNQMAFSDFETGAVADATGIEFTYSPAGLGVGRTGDYSFFFGGNKLWKTLQKASVSNYKLSFWLKSGSSAIDVNIILKNSSNVEVYNKTLTVNPTANVFSYFEELVPVTSATSTFTIELKGVNVPIGSNTFIDDVAFYPENTDITTYTYNLPFGASSITAAASTVFIAHDALGREKFVKDSDGNIVRKNTYKFPSILPPSITATINVGNYHLSSDGVVSSPIELEDLTPLSFTANEDACVTDVMYEWDFGDGLGYQNLGRVVNHTFTALNTITIKLRKTHSESGSIVRTIYAKIVPRISSANICAKGVAYRECATVIDTYGCADISETPAVNSTIFKYLSNELNESVQSYEWIQGIEGGQWTTVGTGQTVTLGLGQSYDVKCIVTTGTGRKAHSNVMTVTSETCTVPNPK